MAPQPLLPRRHAPQHNTAGASHNAGTANTAFRVVHAVASLTLALLTWRIVARPPGDVASSRCAAAAAECPATCRLHGRQRDEEASTSTARNGKRAPLFDYSKKGKNGASSAATQTEPERNGRSTSTSTSTTSTSTTSTSKQPPKNGRHAPERDLQAPPPLRRLVPERDVQSQIPPFTYQQLAVMKAIAQTQNFTEAGKLLYMSQTHISKEVEKLEQALNVQLFNRARGLGGVTLTEAGHLLLRYADRSLTIANEAQVALNDLLTLKTGELALGASQTTGTYLMPKLIATFRHRFPFVDVALQVDSTNRICSAVAEGDVDCAVIGGEVPRDLERSLHTALYRHDELALIISPRHPFAQQMHGGEPRGAAEQVITIEDLYHLDFVALEAASTTQRAHEELLRANGINVERLNVSMALNNIEAIKSAVSCDLGAAFVSVMAIEKELKLGTLSRVLIDGVRLRRSLQVVTNPSRYRSRAVEAFTELVLPWSSL
ncbi:hypothetical protein PPROV_000093400 [Pycnococcus provasolii]|uniref:Probable RuBisCO transcriptional regulator n=1 Tax=Pycnococcus provasolii TaxID=41880 RepID=A0A830HAU5_9CHLO|nr:hypothetical protein PPROV_000093400 [Pycnococcus provasolii]